MVAALSLALHTVLAGNPIGIDFYVFWLAGKELAIENQSPYSSAVTLQSQLGIYGRPALPGEDQMAFAYPPFALLPVLPLLEFHFDWAQAVWMAINLVALVLTVIVAFPQGPRWLPFVIIGLYPFTFGLLLGNFVILISCVFLLSYRLLIKEVPGASAITQCTIGLLLAWTAAKPQFSWLYLLAFVLVAARRRYYRLILGLLSGAILLATWSFVIWPGWVQDWLAQLAFYASYTQPSPFIVQVMRLWLPGAVALPVALISIGIILGFIFWLTRQVWLARINFLTLLAWVGFTTFLLHPGAVSYEHLSFLIPFICWTATPTITGRFTKLTQWLVLLPAYWLLFTVSRSYPHVALLPDTIFLAYGIWLIVYQVPWKSNLLLQKS